MIGWLKGQIIELFEDRLLLQTGGVGYEVFIPFGLFETPLSAGQELEIYIHTNVREDALQLFGFPNLRDREAFSLFTSVSGIGARKAMGILSVGTTEKLLDSIRRGDSAFLQQAPGVGKKVAERIVLELRDKVKKIPPLHGGLSSLKGSSPFGNDDIVSALSNLGYRSSEIDQALARLDLPENSPFDKIFKESLKLLAK